MQIIKQSLITIIICLVILTGVNLVYAWTGPPGNPPDPNASAPINVGTTAQTFVGSKILNVKSDGTGSLGINGALTVNGLGIFNSNVGIGTASPSQKLDVVGTVKMTGFQLGTSATAGYVLTTNASGVGTWQAAAGGGSGTVTNIATGPGLTGGPITTTGTISLNTAGINVAACTSGTGTGKIYWDTTNSRLGCGTDQTSVGGGITCSGTCSSGNIPKFTGASSVANSQIYDNGTNVGIGTASPGAKLEVAGQIKITGGTPGAGKVLTSDASGLASWQAASGSGLPAGASGQTLRHDGTNWVANSVIYNNGTYVGIGTASPGNRLDVSGNIGLRSRIFPGILGTENGYSLVHFKGGTDTAGGIVRASKGTDDLGNAPLRFEASGFTFGGGNVNVNGNVSANQFCLPGASPTGGCISTWPSGGGGGGTVSSITAGTGLTGGTITTSGTIALNINSSGCSSASRLYWTGSQLACGTDQIGAAGTGDITDVIAGSGLTGGASSGSATLNVGAGSGISVAADTVALSYPSKSCSAGYAVQSFNLGSSVAPTCVAVGGASGVTSVTGSNGVTASPTTGAVGVSLAYSSKSCSAGQAIQSFNLGSSAVPTCVATGGTAGTLSCIRVTQTGGCTSTVNCPAGYSATGGGFTPCNECGGVEADYPSGNPPTGWTFEIGTCPYSSTYYVVCCKVQ